MKCVVVPNPMLRARALLALLLTVSWCAATWHVGLDALGLLLDHEHWHEHATKGHAVPELGGDGHEEVVARGLAKDPIRFAVFAVTAIFLLAFAGWVAAIFRAHARMRAAPRQWRETDPPSARIWHFLQRCAPPALAPPGLG